jgi:light-regulated signal transduction histidine kinase (bacteriophytochrome)
MPALDLSECAREPIHAPGAIQPHGAFLAVESGRFTITHASMNTSGLLGRSAREVIGQSLESIFGGAATRFLREGQPEAMSSRVYEYRPAGGPALRLHGFPAGGLLGIDIEPLAAPPPTPLFTVQSIARNFKSAETARDLCDMAVRGLRDLTGYDRVVAYRFHADGHGEVIAESRAPAAEAFLGLRYPASDVPPQAHALYLRKLVGVIADTEAAAVPVLGAPAWPGQTPLDLSRSDLRAVSPMHLQYMRNMNTAAALRIGLPDGDRLWGLLLCHHLSPRLASPALRTAAALVGQIAALKLRNLSAAEIEASYGARKALLAALQQRLAAADPIQDILRGSETELLGLTGATGALVQYDNAAILLGQTPPQAACRRLLDHLRCLSPDQVAPQNDLSVRYPKFSDYAASASGVLFLPLAPGDAAAHGNADSILWFRPEQVRTVAWGGNPAEHAILDTASGQISPRRSFAAWRETMRGRSLPWTQMDAELAVDLRGALTAAAAQRLRDQLARLRDYDTLTGLPSWDRLAQWLGEAGAQHHAQIALLAIDLGDLGEVSLTLGKAGVKALLIELARRLRPIDGKDSLAARHGDAEFILLFLGLGPVELESREAAIRQAIEQPYLLQGQTIRLRPTYRCTYVDDAAGRDIGGAAELAIAAAKADSAFKRQVDIQRQKMEGLGRVMGGIAHEVNNMLQPVTLLGQDVLDRQLLLPEAAETLGIMLDCTRQASHIIGNVLAFSRPKRRGTEPVDPAELLREKLRLVRQSIQPGVTVAVEIEDGLPDILANRTTFAQILVNLASNASAAMAGSGTLTVTLTGAGDGMPDNFIGGTPFVQLVVRDSGCGMDSETLAHAFEPFFTTKPVGVGTGLGLPVVFGLVEEMSGTITLESAPGAGTAVTIRFPRAPGPQPAADAHEPGSN